MNVVVLTGNICKDNELKETGNKKKVLTNTIAVRKDKKDLAGNYESDFIEVVFFESKAEFINNYSSKGDKIEVIGKLRNDTWKDEQGQYHTRSYIVADKVNIISSKKKEKTKTSLEITEEDLPF